MHSFLHQEIGRNSILNPGTYYHDIALEKAIPAPFLHQEKGQFVFRAEAQNFANHNNVGELLINLQYVGTELFQNVSNAREINNRALRFWAKYTLLATHSTELHMQEWRPSGAPLLRVVRFLLPVLRLRRPTMRSSVIGPGFSNPHGHET